MTCELVSEEHGLLFLHERLVTLEEEREAAHAAIRRSAMLEVQIRRLKDLCDYLSPRPYEARP